MAAATSGNGWVCPAAAPKMTAQPGAATHQLEPMTTTEDSITSAAVASAAGHRASKTSNASSDTEPSGKPASVDTLFYDGQCPLCAGEIAQLRSARGDALRIVDIHALKDGAAILEESAKYENPPSKDQLLRILHLQRADGAWLTSADANVAAWEGTNHGRVLRALRWPVVRHAVDLVYWLWARWRYKRLYGEQFDERQHASSQQ